MNTLYLWHGNWRTKSYGVKMAKDNHWTEQNQKAEFLGGAIAGGCGIIFFVGIILFVISAYAFCGDGC